MGVGSIGTGSDDDEGRFRMALGHNGFGDIDGDLRLGTARSQELRYPGMHTVDSRARGAQRVDLGGVLDHPQTGQHRCGQYWHRAESRGQRQQVQRRHGVGHSHPCVPAERIGHQHVGILTVDPLQHRQTQIGRRRVPQRRPLQPRQHHDRLGSRRGNDQRGQAFESLRP